MENEKILAVIAEMLNDQKDNTKMLINLKNTMDELEARLDSVTEIISHKLSSNTLINSEFERLTMTKLDELKKDFEFNNKKINREKRILLFPEHNAKEYYSVVLRWILYIIIATYSYWLLKDFSPFYK